MILRDCEVSGYSGWQDNGPTGTTTDRADQAWRIYAFTDRPAYRPKETVQWKFIARRVAGGSQQVVPWRSNQLSRPGGRSRSRGFPVEELEPYFGPRFKTEEEKRP